ncbi:MAG: exostosin [Candidatus Helarchaeota archaeon]
MEHETKIKIYSDKCYLPAGKVHTAILFPFWGKNPEHPNDPLSGRFDKYTKIGNKFFQMVSIDEADYVVVPTPWAFAMEDDNAINLTKRLVEKTNAKNKKVIIFFWSDSDIDIPFDNCIVFRTSLYNSKRKKNEFAMPTWSEDFIVKYLGGKVPIRSKQKKPIVGFCGYAFPLKKTFKHRVNNFIRSCAHKLGIGKSDIPLSKTGLGIRAKAMCNLSKSSLIDTNFIIRNKFFGGAFSNNNDSNFEIKQKVRMEFVQNMIQSDYILCVRGAGNYSYRLYETLSCGRIPIFINTDCVLPYDFEIKWKKYCIWIDESELYLIAEKVSDFHKNISPSDFIKLQQDCRNLWEKWLSPEGFFSNFYRHFQNTKILE